MNEQRFELRILSMVTEAARRARAESMMAGLPRCDWRFFDALPPDRLNIFHDDVAAFCRYGSILSPAEISCAASHIAMMEEFLAGGASHLIVIEDDVFVDPFIRFNAFCRFMAHCDIDYLKFAARFFVPSRYLAHVGRLVFYRASWPPLGTQCYALSRNGAWYFLELFRVTGLDAPIDRMMDTYWRTKMPIILTFPFPTMELGFPSGIHQSHRVVDARNKELRSQLGIKPSKVDQVKERAKRLVADRRMRSLDVELIRKIERQRSEFRALFHG